LLCLFGSAVSEKGKHILERSLSLTAMSSAGGTELCSSSIAWPGW
jgi:hypothetical protein